MEIVLHYCNYGIMKLSRWILFSFFVINTIRLFSQSASIDIGIHYPISTKSDKDNFPASVGTVIFNSIVSNPTLVSSITNALQVADVVSIGNQNNINAFNYPGATLGGSYTFKNKIRVNLSASFYEGIRKGENNFIFIKQSQTKADTLPITFHQKQFTIGLQPQVSYIFCKKKIHPYLGVGFSWLYRIYKPITYNLSGINFSNTTTTKQHGIGVNTDFGVQFNAHQHINVNIGATYQGIKFLNNNFVSIPSVYATLSVVFPTKGNTAANMNITVPSNNLSYYYINPDSIIYWYPDPVFDVPPPGDVCMPDDMDIREKINKLIELLNKLKALGDKTQEELEDNDLYNEVQALKSILELLDLFKNYDKIDSTMLSAMTEFMMCNSKPLRDQISTNKDVVSNVILPLKMLKMIIGAKMMDKSLPKAERDKLKKVYKYLKEKIEQIEKAVEKGENIDKILEYYDKLKEDINWPADLLKSLLESALKELQKAVEKKAEEEFKKELQKILTKILGNASAAKAAISIGKDIKDLIDAWDKLNKLKETDIKWNEGLLKIIELAKSGKMYAEGADCVWWNIDGAEIGKVIITAHMQCWCPKKGGKPGEGEWKNTPVDLEDSNGKTTKKITVDKPESNGKAALKVKVPPKSKRECDADKCIVFIDVEIYDKKGKLISGGSMVAGVPSD